MLRTHQIKMKPNAHMRNVIDSLFDYRRYCWNTALGIWNDRYTESVIKHDQYLTPKIRDIRNEMVNNKQDWEYYLSPRVMQQALLDLNQAWSFYFNSQQRKPCFKSKKDYKRTFSTDRARIKNGRLLLDKPQLVSKSEWYSIKLCESLRFSGDIKKCTIIELADGLYANLVVETTDLKDLPKKHGVTGVDANIKRFNYSDGVFEIYGKKLDFYYRRIAYYQKCLARKRRDNPNNFNSNRYKKVKTKLRRDYQKVSRIQQDSLHKFTNYLICNYGEIHIEDLDVSHMMMSSKMGKNLHRSLFSKFRSTLVYKCEWYSRSLVIVDRCYPSTQICSDCGYRKTNDSYGGKQTLNGDSIHKDHQLYYCYECGSILDRDVNAVQNIINYNA